MEHPDLVELMAAKTVGLSWFDRMAPPAAIGAVSYGDMGSTPARLGQICQRLAKRRKWKRRL